MTTFRVPARPSKRIYHAFRRRQFSWLKGFCELTDNSIDAAARLVRLHMERSERFSLEDDGRGIRKETLQTLLELGGHAEHDTTQTGEFGVGLKDFVIWLWGTFSVRTINSGSVYTTRVHLPTWVSDPDPDFYFTAKERRAPVGAEPGTRIVLEAFDRKRPSETQWTELMQRLAFLYTPSLQSGIAIQSKWFDQGWQSLAPYRPDYVGETIYANEAFGAGKHATLRAVLLSPGVHAHSGIQITRGPRINEVDSPLGIGKYSRSGVYVDVQLQPKSEWALSTNKEELDDPVREELGEWIYSVIHPLLRRSQAQQLAFRDESILERIQELVGAANKKKRPPAGAGPSNGGSGQGQEDGPEDGRESNVDRQGGSGAGGRGLKIKFESLSSEYGLGRAVKNVIELNETDRFIRAWRHHEDQDLAARILANQVLWIYETSDQVQNKTKTGDMFDQSRSSHVPARVGLRLDKLADDPNMLVRLAINGTA